MKFEREIEKLFFIILGTFITSSYSRDFTLLELVRKPLQFPISKNGNYFVAKIPKGLPWQETVVILGDAFATKTKDIPIRKGIQKADEANDLFVLDAGEFNQLFYQDGFGDFTQGALSYYPLYRFVTEPFAFKMNENVLAYVSNAIVYVLKREGFKCFVESKNPEKYEVTVTSKGNLIEQILVFGDKKLDKLELHGKGSISALNFIEKKVSLARAHSPVCFEALFKTGDDNLSNISLKKTEERIDLSYDS